MIYHVIRMKVRDDAPPAQLEEALHALADQGTAIPSVKFFASGHEYSGEFDRTAILAFDDLEGYQQYLTHPAHKRSERLGFPVMAAFEAIDISESADPDLGARIAAMQQANYAADPQLVELVGGLASHTGAAAVSGVAQSGVREGRG